MSDFIKDLMRQVAENFTKNSGNPDAYIARKQDWADKVVPAKLPGKAVKLPELDEHGVYKGKPVPPNGGGKPVQKSLVVHTMADLAKAKTRGGRYTKRVPTGNPERPWKYFYPKKPGASAGGPGSEPPDDGYRGPLREGMSLTEAEDAIRHEPMEHALVVNSKGRHLLRKTSGRPNFVEMTADEVRRFRGEAATLTHNHPQGTCLGATDIVFAARAGLAEIRACGKRGTYSLKEPVDGWIPPHVDAMSPEFSWEVQGAYDTAVRRATIRMDEHITANGGIPGDATHPSFSQEKFNEWTSEEAVKSYNDTFRKYGWVVEFRPVSDARGNAEERGSPDRRDPDVRKSDSEGGHWDSSKSLVVYSIADLAKGKARGGKYYRRTPTGIPERPWRYWYSKEEYEKEHGDKAHLHGPDVKQGLLDFDAKDDGPGHREAAVAALKADAAAGEYVNDRKSRVGQRGEDVLGSARHKAAEWKSARAAASSPQAEQMFTLSFLGRQEPLDFHSATTAETAENVMFLYLAFNRFDSKPRIPFASLDQHVYWGGKLKKPADGSELGRETVGKEEHERRQRLRYYDGYDKTRAIFERHLQAPSGDLSTLRRSLIGDLETAATAMRAEHGLLDTGANAIASVVESVAKGGRGNSAASQVLKLEAKLNEKYPGAQRGDAAVAAVKAILDGKSLNAAFGEAKKAGPRKSIAGLFSTEGVVRDGPASEYESIVQGEDLLDKRRGGKYGLRGLEWGRTLPDGEREHHLKALVDSFKDLTDALDFPPGMASFNGRLAVGVGSRGKAGTLATYFHDKQIINLNRTGGAGSLAHEWGHFFDHTVGKVHGVGTAVNAARSEAHEHLPVVGEMRAMFKSPEWAAWRSDSVKGVGELIEVGYVRPSDYGEWASDTELWARTFERYVQVKLRKSGRKNTYLASNPGGGAWPTDEHIAALEPHLDKVFAAFRSSDLLKKALVRLANGRPVRVRSMSEL